MRIRRRTISIQNPQRFISIFLIIFSLAALDSKISFADDRFSKERFLGQGDEPWKITARKMTYREKEGIYDAEGDVIITRGGQTLYAQKASYNMETGAAELEGDVRLESGGDILTGEKGMFDLKARTGKIINGNLFLKENHFYIKGGLMERLDEDTYLAKECHVTTCDGENPAWSITGSQVKVTIEGYGTVKNAALRVHNVPVLYVPYMIFPAKTKRQSGLLGPRLGSSSRSGLDVEIPFFWAISDQTDATFYQHYLSKRGYMQGLEFRYVLDGESKGSFLFDILSDKKDKDLNDPDDVELSPYPRTNQTRYWVRGRADQDLPHGIVARLDADYVSDQDYLNEFDRGGPGFESRPYLAEESGRPVEEKRSPIRTTALRVSHDDEDYSLQALGSYYQLPGNPIRDLTAEPLGGLFFSLLPASINGSPAIFSLESDYDYVWRENTYEKDFTHPYDLQKGHRLSLSPKLSLPLKFARYMEFEPSIRYTLNPQYAQGDRDRQALKVYETGARMSTRFDRVFDVDFMGAERLKHKIQPIVSYAYREYLDEVDQSPWFEPVAVEGDANLVTLSIENFLDARIGDEKGNVFYRRWTKFALSQSYYIDEERYGDQADQDNEPFGPLGVEMTLNPFPNLNFFGDARWDHYDHKITYLDLSLELTVDRSGGRKDRFNLDYQYNTDDFNMFDQDNLNRYNTDIFSRYGLDYFNMYNTGNRKSINLWFDVNLIRGFSTGSSLVRDMNLDKSISNRYWVQYQRQCWGVKLIGGRENEESIVMVEFQLFGLGNIGVH